MDGQMDRHMHLKLYALLHCGEGIKKFMISIKECCRNQQGSNLQPSDHQSDAHLTELLRLEKEGLTASWLMWINIVSFLFIEHTHW